MIPLDITFLGTGSAQPSATRNHQSMALRVNGEIWLFDAGEATQHQLQKSDLKMGRITKIFITHMHGDHCFGLPPLLCTVSENMNANRTESAPIDVYGPPPLRAWLRASLGLTHSRLGRPYRVHTFDMPDETSTVDVAMHPDELPGNDFPLNTFLSITDTWQVAACAIQHSVPSLGFALKEDPIPGKLDRDRLVPLLHAHADALRAQGFKQPLAALGQLQKGKAVVLPDLTLTPPEPRPGRTVVILGDTRCPDSILDMVHGVDLLVHEATNALTALDKPGTTQQEVEARTKDHGHSTPHMAGDFAKRLGAKRMILTHFSARYRGDTDPESLAIMETIRKQAIETFGSDQVECARDFSSFEIKVSS